MDKAIAMNRPATRESGPSSVLRRLRLYAGIAVNSLGWAGKRHPSGPLEVQIGIADPCNHRCVMCCYHPPEERKNDFTIASFGDSKQGLMDLQTFKDTIDDLYAMGTRNIELAGRGEPLLNKHATEMIAYAKSRGFTILLTTNASRLSAGVAEALVEAGLDRMHVSINAGEAETYPRIHVTENPENYLKVLANLRRLADIKSVYGTGKPYVGLSFAIGGRNYHELVRMVERAHETGSEEAFFQHTALHPDTPDLALSDSEYHQLIDDLVPQALQRAEALGVHTTLRSFASALPPYRLDEEEPEPVPCYVGSYYGVILGNGHVMACCQCSSSLGQLGENTRFRDIWQGQAYRNFRDAARRLPEASDEPTLKTCDCGHCILRQRNLSVHNALHPLSGVAVENSGEHIFRLRDLWAMQKSR